MRLMIGAALLLLLPAASAYAGGIGVLATGGVHTERHYYYSNVSEDGTALRNIDDYPQFQYQPLIPQAGGGFELLLGDRDEPIQGSMRFFYSAELAPPSPSAFDSSLDPDQVVSNIRDDIRHLGFGMVGLTWGIVGDPGGFQFNAVGHIGAAFITLDHSEFLAFQIGPGFSWRMSRQMQLFGDLQYQGRIQKSEFGHAGLGNVGIRYLFD